MPQQVWLVTPSDDRVAKQIGSVADQLAGENHDSLGIVRPTSPDDIVGFDPTDHIVYLGHGKPDSPYMRSGRLFRTDHTLFDSTNIGGSSRLVLAIACSSGAVLGPRCGSMGDAVVAYIGWLDELGVPRRSAPIVKAIHAGVTSFLAGDTAADVCQAFRDAFDEAHAEYSEMTGLAPVSRRWGKLESLYWKDRIRVFGDPKAARHADKPVGLGPLPEADLLERATSRAIEEGVSVDEIVGRALRQYLDRSEPD